MFDTDGGIGIDKRTIYKKPYVRINYTSASKELIKQLTLILSNYNIPHSIHKKGNAEMIQINGEKNVKKYLLEIGFSNKRHLDKLKDIFRKQ
jgi:intein/homing endonuclease